MGAGLKRDIASRESVEQHVDALQARERALVLGRHLLRQVADAFAWVVLRQDARVILPLYREQTHELPRREGLGGPAEIARQAMKSGKFFVIENDLTRCLGLGDLTVVSVNGCHDQEATAPSVGPGRGAQTFRTIAADQPAIRKSEYWNCWTAPLGVTCDSRSTRTRVNRGPSVAARVDGS